MPINAPTQKMIEAGHDCRVRECCCVIWFGRAGTSDEQVGTGTLIRVSGRVFILTCEHVAAPFLESPLQAFLIPSEPIKHDQLTLFRSSKRHDIALIEVSQPLPKRFVPLVPDEFDLQNDFTGSDTVNKQFILSGWPGELVRAEPWERTFTLFKYCTAGASVQQKQKSVFRIGYPLDVPEKNVPEPKGLSGSIVVEIPGPNAFIGKIATYRAFKVVGLVMAWERNKEQLVCTGLSQLRKWIEEIEGSSGKS